jgi:epoxyqueuosine reductase
MCFAERSVGNSITNATYTEKIKNRGVELGADLVGVADTAPLKKLELCPPDLLDPFHRALSVAIRLPGSLFEQIADHPTPMYASAYRTANLILDEIAFLAANTLQRDGFSSLPIPATESWDPENHYGAISHKAVGRMAGLGWQGKSLLLVNPEYGPRIRLVTVLTDAPLEVNGPVKNGCGECTLCRNACPAGAIKGVVTKTHYKSREEALDLRLCVEKLNEFAKLPGVDANICGICIKVCPFGR